MRFQKFSDIPNEGWLNTCWQRAGEARQKWQDRGVLSLTPDDIHDIVLVGSEADGEKIRAEAAAARAKQAPRAKPATTVKAREPGEFYLPKQNTGKGFAYLVQILRHPDNAHAKLMAGDLAEVLDLLDEYLKSIYVCDTRRNVRLDELEERLAALDGQAAGAAERLKGLTYENAVAINAIEKV